MISFSKSNQTLLKENDDLTQAFEKETAEVTHQTGSKPELLTNSCLEIDGIGRIGVFSDEMRKALVRARQLHEDPSVPVLIQGETGAGKEVVARFVHDGNGNANTPFVPINCAAISPSLFESELFGYEGCAFTGAKKSGMKGKLELARKGTLFLDEIGDMPLDLQPKLLRVLEEQEFYRVGGLNKVKINTRIICTTNKELVQRVKEGAFRRDLFYRLGVAVIQIPPLRERPEAIEPLAQMFLELYARQKRCRFRSIHKKAVQILKNHFWPGNVRELKNTIRRVVLWHNDIEVRAKHLEFLTSDTLDEFSPKGSQLNPDSIIFPSEGLDLKRVEAEIIMKALCMFNGKRSRVARYLGISRHVLHRKLKKISNTLIT